MFVFFLFYFYFKLSPMDRLKKVYLLLTASGAFFGTIAVTRSYLSGDKYRGNFSQLLIDHIIYKLPF